MEKKLIKFKNICVVRGFLSLILLYMFEFYKFAGSCYISNLKKCFCNKKDDFKLYKTVVQDNRRVERIVILFMDVDGLHGCGTF